MPHVLIFEDDENVAMLLEFMLEREGYVPERVADGRKAAEIIATRPAPDLVITDVMLPHHSGYDLVRLLRGRPEWRSVPVVMITSKSREEDIEHAFRLGVDDYVTKPFQPRELLARVRRLLRRAA